MYFHTARKNNPVFLVDTSEYLFSISLPFLHPRAQLDIFLRALPANIYWSLSNYDIVTFGKGLSRWRRGRSWAIARGSNCQQMCKSECSKMRLSPVNKKWCCDTFEIIYQKDVHGDDGKEKPEWEEVHSFFSAVELCGYVQRFVKTRQQPGNFHVFSRVFSLKFSCF